MVMFLKGVAGYSSSASVLNRRSEAELRAALEFLAQPFFDKYPDYAIYRTRITAQLTPELAREMKAAEDNRVDLLLEIQHLLSPNGA
jgi:hypothetical protein